MSFVSHHVYLVGDFFAKYYGKRKKQSATDDGPSYGVVTYDHRVTHGAYVWDAAVPSPTPNNYLRIPFLEDVEIQFTKDPAGYGKLFREDLRDVVITDIKLEGVVKEHKRSFGTMRGRIYVRVHSVAAEK